MDAYCAKSAKSFLKLASCIFRNSGYSGFICPTSCLQSPKCTSLFLSKWSVCGQKKKKQNGWLNAGIQNSMNRSSKNSVIILSCLFHSKPVWLHSAENKRWYFEEVFFLFCPYNRSQWGTKLHYCKKQHYCLSKNTRHFSKFDFPESHTGLEQEGDRIMTELNF